MPTYEVFERLTDQPQAVEIVDAVKLDHLEREKGRLKLESVAGNQVRIFIQRGQLLKESELLPTRCGKHVRVDLANEAVITASTDDWKLFSQACYHLGNRHTRIQIGDRWLRFLPDPVLVELVQLIGLVVREEMTAFVPEAGAYTRADAHGHSHGHTHAHG